MFDAQIFEERDFRAVIKFILWSDRWYLVVSRVEILSVVGVGMI